MRSLRAGVMDGQFLCDVCSVAHDFSPFHVLFSDLFRGNDQKGND